MNEDWLNNDCRVTRTSDRTSVLCATPSSVWVQHVTGTWDMYTTSCRHLYARNESNHLAININTNKLHRCQLIIVIRFVLFLRFPSSIIYGYSCMHYGNVDFDVRTIKWIMIVKIAAISDESHRDLRVLLRSSAVDDFCVRLAISSEEENIFYKDNIFFYN